MFRKLTLVLTMLVVAACAPATAPTGQPAPPTESALPAAAQQPSPAAIEETSPWDGAYEKIPPDLCPPDGEPVGQPTFAEPAPEPYDGDQVKEVWVQPGLFANEQGELFRIDVIGATPEAVKLYTEQVKICLDQMFTGDVTGGETQPGFDQPSKEFGVNPEDLSIEVYLLGFFEPAMRDQVFETLLSVPAQQWKDVLVEMKWTPDLARPEEFTQDYVVDFVIDPTANNRCTHHYPERSATRAWVNISVAGGGGSVTSRLCRNGGSVDTATVTQGGLASDTMSHDNGGTRATYDLGVKGNPNGTYRVSGRWGWASWSAAYLDPAPAGSLQNCSP
jgi:hypothetical protein